jgi:putative transposase
VHLAARSANLTAADRDLLAVPKADWAFAKRQERIVKSALRVGAMEAARSTGCSKRTIYRLLASYRMNPTLLAFLPRRRGSAVGSHRLDPDREAIIAQAVEQWMSSREPVPVARAVEEAARLAKAAGLKAVARNSIVRRLLAQGGNPNRRLSSLERRVLPDIPKTRRALGIVQADHTPVDLILVDDINRQPIGRPWITIIFDVALS